MRQTERVCLVNRVFSAYQRQSREFVSWIAMGIRVLKLRRSIIKIGVFIKWQVRQFKTSIVLNTK